MKSHEKALMHYETKSTMRKGVKSLESMRSKGAKTHDIINKQN